MGNEDLHLDASYHKFVEMVKFVFEQKYQIKVLGVYEFREEDRSRINEIIDINTTPSIYFDKDDKDDGELKSLKTPIKLLERRIMQHGYAPENLRNLLMDDVRAVVSSYEKAMNEKVVLSKEEAERRRVGK